MLVDKIESCGYACEAGPLEMSDDWLRLKEKCDLWIIVKRDQNICHTSGNGGWRFTVCTCKEEAEWLANLYNKERYGGAPICSVEHWQSHNHVLQRSPNSGPR